MIELKAMNRLKVTGFEHYMHENIMWERTLDFYLQQNAFLKTKLSQALDEMTGKEFLSQAEYFQSSFIHNDECMKDLQKDIDNLQRLLKNGNTITSEESSFKLRHNKLRNEINNFEKKFTALKSEFNQYMNAIS